MTIKCNVDKKWVFSKTTTRVPTSLTLSKMTFKILVGTLGSAVYFSFSTFRIRTLRSLSNNLWNVSFNNAVDLKPGSTNSSSWPAVISIKIYQQCSGTVTIIHDQECIIGWFVKIVDEYYGLNTSK